MNILIALAVGYLVGARTGGKDLDQLTRSVKALCETDEFADVMVAARAQVAATLRELASIVDGGQAGTAPSGDLVARVRHMVGRE
jgi:hypothetical protein